MAFRRAGSPLLESRGENFPASSSSDAATVRAAPARPPPQPPRDRPSQVALVLGIDDDCGTVGLIVRRGPTTPLRPTPSIVGYRSRSVSLTPKKTAEMG